MNESHAANDPQFGATPEDAVLVTVYCKACNKTHAVMPHEQECFPGAWSFEGEGWPSDA